LTGRDMYDFDHICGNRGAGPARKCRIAVLETTLLIGWFAVVSCAWNRRDRERLFRSTIGQTEPARAVRQPQGLRSRVSGRLRSLHDLACRGLGGIHRRCRRPKPDNKKAGIAPAFRRLEQSGGVQYFATTGLLNW
jgi:hypothetical protein